MESQTGENAKKKAPIDNPPPNVSASSNNPMRDPPGLLHQFAPLLPTSQPLLEFCASMNKLDQLLFQKSLANRSGAGHVNFFAGTSGRIVNGVHAEEWHSMSDEHRAIYMREKRKREAFRTEMCKGYLRSGFCRYGEECRFAHDPNELRLRPTHAKYKTELCRNYSSTGVCIYGSRCQFIHRSTPGIGPLFLPPTSSSRLKLPQHFSASSMDPLMPISRLSLRNKSTTTRPINSTTITPKPATVSEEFGFSQWRVHNSSHGNDPTTSGAGEEATTTHFAKVFNNIVSPSQLTPVRTEATTMRTKSTTTTTFSRSCHPVINGAVGDP